MSKRIVFKSEEPKEINTDDLDKEFLESKLMDNFEKEYINNNLQKLLLGEIKVGDGKGNITTFKVISVNGDYIKLNMNINFVEGGNGFVYDYIPKNELWVDNDIESKDYAPILLHELYEAILIRDYNLEYEKAHKMANELEKQFRLGRLNK